MLCINKRFSVSQNFQALNAKRGGAAVLAIVNNVDKIDNIASGFGVDKNVTEVGKCVHTYIHTYIHIYMLVNEHIENVFFYRL